MDVDEHIVPLPSYYFKRKVRILEQWLTIKLVNGVGNDRNSVDETVLIDLDILS